MNETRYTFLRNPLTALLLNLLTVFVLFTLCRLVFIAVNWTLYAETLTWGHALELMSAGLIFDTTAILYTNALLILAFLFPLHWKERPAFYRGVRWLYVITNWVAVAANLMDCVYFPYTGKRTTTSVFLEFSNEGAGGMTKIMAEQFLANWYLVLLGLALGWVLWRLFCFPWKHENGTLRLPVYYVCQVVVLLAAIPLTVAGMRGGFAHAVRPITISNANQFVDRPAETGIVLNTPFSIYRTLSKKPLTIPHYMSESEAAALFSPIHEPQDTLPFQPRNVVVFILESFSKQHFGFYNQTLRPGQAYPGFTPFLDSLIVHGAKTWRYSYANGRKSIEGMPSVLSSLPNYVEPLFLTPASLNHLSGLARELGEHEGYTTAFFHGAQNNSMGFQAFARSTGFQRYFGRNEYNDDPHYGGDDDFDGTWAIWDEEFMQFFADRMGEMKQPFMTALFSATSHTPFSLPSRYDGVLPEGEHPLQRCIAYTDNALRQFFSKASRQPWFKNTLFIITADHTSAQLDPVYTTSLGHYDVPIIFYAPGDSLLRGYDTHQIAEQTDIMPTVMGYLHYPYSYVGFGCDLLTTPPSETHALHWVPETTGYEFVKGDYVVEFDGQEVTAAYRYRTDSLLLHDVKTTMPQDTLRLLTRQMQSIIQQYMQRMNNDQLTIRPAK